MQGFAADPVYVMGEVFAYVGLPQNLKDLKDLRAVKGVSSFWFQQPGLKTVTGNRPSRVIGVTAAGDR
jgi:hypothetical protein